jgi:hypothetical protein
MAARHSDPELPYTNDPDSTLPHTPRTPNSLSASSTNTFLAVLGGSHPPHNRHTMTIYPAPYTSPLSSSLSAMVADSLRRGVDTRRLRHRRSARPRLSNMTLGPETRHRGNSEPNAEAQADALRIVNQAGGSENDSTASLRRSRTAEETSSHSEPSTPLGSRRRSVTMRLGDFLRRARMRPGRNGGAGESSGPDGSGGM